MDNHKRIIGVVPPHTGADLNVVPYLQGCINGVLNEAYANANDVLLIVSVDWNDADGFHKRIREDHVDGLVVIAPGAESHHIRSAVSLACPYTVISSQVPSSVCITVDNMHGIALGVEHLWSLGHRKIAHLHGPLDITDSVERLEGFRRAMLRLALDVPTNYIDYGGIDVDGGQLGMRRLIWLEDRPTAVVCFNDGVAVGAMRAVWESGLRVPADVNVLGFDDSVYSIAAFPTITTIRQPWTEMGMVATRKLLDLMEGRPAESEVMSCDLVIRNSTSKPGEDVFRNTEWNLPAVG